MTGSLVVFAVAATYFLLFRSYGFQLEDEGNILFLLDRYVRGQAPYLDFHTGYTPGFFAIGSMIYRWLGEETAAVRGVLAIVNAATAAGMYALARRHAPAWIALHAPLLWVVFLPVFRGEFASFNVPYPAWFAALGWIGLAAALERWQRVGSPGWLVAAGLAAAFAFSTKVNAGAFAMVGATFVVALGARRRAAIDAIAAMASTVAMSLGTLVAFGGDWRSADGIVHLLPLAALAAICVAPSSSRFSRRDGPGAAGALLVLYGTFSLATLPWAGPLIVELGPLPFLREVLLLGSGYGHLYYTPHPSPEPYALALVLGLVAAALGGRAAARARLDMRVPLAAASLAVLGGAVLLARQPMAESLVTSVRLQLENASFWLVPTIHLAGIAALYRAASPSARAADRSALIVAVPLAVAMYWQLFPRSDFMHVIASAPLTLVLGARLGARVAAWWALASWPGPVSGAAVLRWVSVTVAVLVAVLTVPHSAGGALECVVNRKAQLATARVRVCLETGVTDDVEALSATVAFVERLTLPGEAVLAFPALAVVPFAAERTAPVPHDYWYPGRPSHDEEIEMVATLAREPPRYVVTLNDGWTFFAAAPAYFSELRRFVVERYRLVGRFGRYDVLALGKRKSARVAGTGAVRQAGAGDVAEPLLAARRQAARRWMRSLTLIEAHQPDLATDTRSAVLQLRAIRDGGDLRTAGWILQGFDGDDARVRAESVAAMDAVVVRFGAARHRWANDLVAGDYAPYLAPWADQVERLVGDADPRVRSFGEALALVFAEET